MDTPCQETPPGAFAPLSYFPFALLWTATLVSNIGTWMHEVGAGWLMTTLDPTPATVSMVQAATTWPMFCFALLAGTLADRFDKRRMLLLLNFALAAIVTLLAVLVWNEQMTPTRLIVFTFAIGTGVAFMAPAWQAVVPSLVPRAALKPAIALNSMGINIGRVIGPAIAGVLIASVGLAAPFALNAVSYVVILAALLLWKPAPTPRRTARSALLSEMSVGLRHVRHSPAILATIVRACAFFLSASAYWALLPLVARSAQGGGSELYGTLMALIGSGAVTGALLLPRLSRSLSPDATVQIGTAGTGAALLLLAISSTPVPLMLGAFVGGLAWIAVLTYLNVSAQTALPDWIRARGLAVYLMVFFGTMALGSVIWGQVATYLSVPIALMIATISLGLGAVLTRRFSIGQGDQMDHSTITVWPQAPELNLGQSHDQPATVTVEYCIKPGEVDEFLTLMRQLAKERKRSGASRWEIAHCVEEPDKWIETFHVASWTEHLEQHKRVTKADEMLKMKIERLDRHLNGPTVRHFVRGR